MVAQNIYKNVASRFSPHYCTEYLICSIFNTLDTLVTTYDEKYTLRLIVAKTTKSSFFLDNIREEVKYPLVGNAEGKLKAGDHIS